MGGSARRRIAVTAAFLTVALPAMAQTMFDPPAPTNSQGLIRERDQSRERLRQEQIQRNQTEQLNREQAERAARQRLESGRIERMQPPQIVLPGSPPATTSVPQPGLTDPAAELRRSEDAKRQQLEVDRARQGGGIDNSGSTIGLPGTGWKPIGAR
jgi:hypothetical protein